MNKEIISKVTFICSFSNNNNQKNDVQINEIKNTPKIWVERFRNGIAPWQFRMT